MTFKELNITEPILKAVEEKGYTVPTPIQEKAIPVALVKRDILGCAQTGTGKTASKEEADEACGWVRKTIEEMYGKDAAEAVRVQYGGSVKPANVAELMDMPNIDGALVGGASLTADFAKIVKF